MAFQAGTRVRPELGNADYSGFARAAEIRASALADLGKQIGGAITKYSVNKQKKEEQKLRYEAILPYTTDEFGAAEGEKMAQTFSRDPATAASILQFAQLIEEKPFEPTSRQIDGMTFIETSEGKFVQPRDEADSRTASMKNYDALINQNVPPEEAREMAFGGKGGTNITVGGEAPVGDMILRQTFNEDQQYLLDNVQPALNSIPNLQYMEKMLNVVGDEGEVIAGRLGPLETFLKSVAKDLGFGEFKDVAATEAYLATAGRQVGQIINLFGAGTGLSDADREYAEKIAGGQQALTKEALQKLVRFGKIVIEHQVETFNDQIDRTYTPNIVGEGVSRLAKARLFTPNVDKLFDYDISINAIDGTGASLMQPNEMDEAEEILKSLDLLDQPQ